LAQADKRLPSLATPEEIGIIKFLIAENARMQVPGRRPQDPASGLQGPNREAAFDPAEAQAKGLRDPLTQLDNRRGFDANLAKATGRAQALGSALCLVMGDIDNFKKVNVILPGASSRTPKS
jgi:diguanylate cyclase